MKLCIVGTGAAGWMACAAFKEEHEVVIVGSPKIPPIGVGESNTMRIKCFHNDVGINEGEFVAHSDAAVKYGVYYKGWSKNDFIHNFKNSAFSDALSSVQPMFYRSLVNKPKDVSINELVAVNLQQAIHDNHVFFEDIFYPKSWHFDAGKYIEFLKNHSSDVKLIEETVVNCVKNNDKIIRIITDKNRIIEADYYIFATGCNTEISDILGEEYINLSDVLLTDKALVYPLKYTNQREQFHPCTVAKTMKHGWRWITPTYSRIGTGYVFSSRYTTEEQALNEFLDDIGDHTISPRIVDFHPRYNKETFKQNYCSVGLANGFLEPLDAPGLTLTIDVINHLRAIFRQNNTVKNPEILQSLRDQANERMVSRYEFWASFILTQYKTCSRDDTQFWKDHKRINYDPLNHILNILGDYNVSIYDYIMFMHTIAAKDKRWPSNSIVKPFKQPEYSVESVHHLDYINAIRTSVSQFRSIHTMV